MTLLTQDARTYIFPPMEENALSKETHHRRLSLFCLKDAKSGMSNEVQGSRMCPVMLLRNTSNVGLHKGCSVILPLSWVKAFWMPFVSNGAHAIGLREKRWIANDVGLPYFPSDFPDCYAYYSSKAIEASESDQKMELRPPAKRPFKVAITPPWNRIVEIQKTASLISKYLSPDWPLASGNSNCQMIPLIGSRTSGFVRGSKKPTAVGMAEATKLASLGQEQRTQMPRSRPRKALATLVLARPEDDLEFL